MRKNNFEREISKMLRNELITGVVIGFLFFVALLFLIFSIYIYQEQKIESAKPIPADIPYIINNCKNDSIIKSATCVNDFVKSIYKYNLSNVGKDLTFDNLKKLGGVCSNYAKLYCEIGKSFGFYTKKIDINLEKVEYENDTYNIGHTFCIWSNKEARIDLDQEEMYVFEFGEINNTELIGYLND